MSLSFVTFQVTSGTKDVHGPLLQHQIQAMLCKKMLPPHQQHVAHNAIKMGKRFCHLK